MGDLQTSSSSGTKPTTEKTVDKKINQNLRSQSLSRFYPATENTVENKIAQSQWDIITPQRRLAQPSVFLQTSPISLNKDPKIQVMLEDSHSEPRSCKKKEKLAESRDSTTSYLSYEQVMDVCYNSRPDHDSALFIQHTNVIYPRAIVLPDFPATEVKRLYDYGFLDCIYVPYDDHGVISELPSCIKTGVERFQTFHQTMTCVKIFSAGPEMEDEACWPAIHIVQFKPCGKNGKTMFDTNQKWQKKPQLSRQWTSIRRAQGLKVLHQQLQRIAQHGKVLVYEGDQHNFIYCQVFKKDSESEKEKVVFQLKRITTMKIKSSGPTERLLCQLLHKEAVNDCIYCTKKERGMTDA